jgi:hypothetical protein
VQVTQRYIALKLLLQHRLDTVVVLVNVNQSWRNQCRKQDYANHNGNRNSELSHDELSSGTGAQHWWQCH